MAYSVPPTVATGDVAVASDWNTYIRGNSQHILTAGGLLLHEVGGIEADISAIADGGIVRGTGAGTMAILASFLTAAGILKHEFGGIEADISAIADGGILRGDGAGSMAILASFLTAAGLLTHEYGGLEFDASAITTGGLLKGDSAGVMEILALGAAGLSLEVNAGGTDFSWVTPTRIATGSYSGDGNVSQGITGLGLAPNFVIIARRNTTHNAAVWVGMTWDSMIDDNAGGLAIVPSGNVEQWVTRVNAIILLGADGFTVDDAGADTDPNTNGVTYNFVAVGGA